MAWSHFFYCPNTLSEYLQPISIAILLQTTTSAQVLPCDLANSDTRFCDRYVCKDLTTLLDVKDGRLRRADSAVLRLDGRVIERDCAKVSKWRGSSIERCSLDAPRRIVLAQRNRRSDMPLNFIAVVVVRDLDHATGRRYRRDSYCEAVAKRGAEVWEGHRSSGYELVQDYINVRYEEIVRREMGLPVTNGWPSAILTTTPAWRIAPAQVMPSMATKAAVAKVPSSDEPGGTLGVGTVKEAVTDCTVPWSESMSANIK